MKLKVRADSKDFLIFILFAIFLLYVVALAVLNLSSFAIDGVFYGLNPMEAFSSKYITATILFYVLALGGMFLSVKSYFFDMDKGFGFTTDKKDKGYSRWAKEKEIQDAKNVESMLTIDEKSSVAGTPLMYKGDKVWVDNGESHTLVIGATGSGKTQDIILPTVKILAKKGESMVITDPKGEIYEKTSEMLREKGYQILLLNFRDPQEGNAWNPMTLPYQCYKNGQQDKAIELLDDLALNILYDENNKNADPFWEKTSADYFSGLALGLFEDAKEEEININSISVMSTVGEEKFGGSTYIKEYFNTKDPGGAAYINASSTLMAPSETKGSILSVFKQKIKLFASRENLSEMLSHSDINLESIGEKPTALFVVIQDEKKTYHSLATILIKQIYETLIGVAQRHDGKLPVRTNFLLDEFANMPPLKDVTTMITAARSRQIRFTMIIQNFAQLDEVYGKENAETLRGNCGNLIYLVTTELKALEEISKMCGEVKSKKDDKTASTPLVTISDLQRMKENEAIILRLRMSPFKTKYTPDYKIDWGKKYPVATYPHREKSEVKTFDVREFVKEEKRKKLFEMMEDANGGANPSGTSGMPYGMPNMFHPQAGGRGMPNEMMGNSQGMQRPMSAPGNDFFGPYPPVRPVENKTVEPPKPVDPPQEPKKDFNFDVDALVKKIEAEVAKLEDEEKAVEPPKEEPVKEEKKEPEPKKKESSWNDELVEKIEKRLESMKEEKESDPDASSPVSTSTEEIIHKVEEKIEKEEQPVVEQQVESKEKPDEPVKSTKEVPEESKAEIKEAEEEKTEMDNPSFIEDDEDDDKFFDDFFDDDDE